MCELSFIPLLTRLNENQSRKMSTTLNPRINSGLRGKKDENTPNNLLFESMR